MCIFPSAPPKDDSAERARADEQARQARITEGQANIDKAFEPFNDAFFGKISQDYTNYYEPQLTEQYQNAIKKQTVGLAGTGNLTSSAGANKLAEVRRLYDRSKTAVADAALSAANNLKSQIESNRSDLYNTNRAAADPTQALSLATARAGTLSAPQAYSPLGDIFGSLLKQAGTGLAFEAAGFPGLKTGIFQSDPTNKLGSSKVI